jgi:hypothetical protein
LPVGREPQGVPERQQAPQHGLALPQAEAGHVVAVHVQDVEQVQVHRHPAAAGRLGIAELHPPLQPGEAAAAALEGDHLPVHHEVVGLLRRQGLRQLRVVVVEPFAVAGQQPHLRALTKGQAALTVELRLEDPTRVGEAPVGEGGQHRVGPRRLLGRHGPLAGPAPEAPPADPSCRPAFAGLDGNLLDGPTRDHRLRLALDRLAPGVGLLVVHLDQEPALALALPDAGEGRSRR